MKTLVNMVLAGVVIFVVGCDLRLNEVSDASILASPQDLLITTPVPLPSMDFSTGEDPRPFDDCTRTENINQGFCKFTCSTMTTCIFKRTRTTLSIIAQDSGPPCSCHINFDNPLNGHTTAMAILYEYNLTSEAGTDEAEIFAYSSSDIKYSTPLFFNAYNVNYSLLNASYLWDGNAYGLDVTLIRNSMKLPKTSTFTLYNLSIKDNSMNPPKVVF